MEPHLSWSTTFDKSIKNSVNLEHLLKLSDLIIHRLNFDFYAYTICKPVPFTRPKTHIIGNYPEQWIKRYKEQG